MTDWALAANPRNGTSVVTETGITVYNGVQDEAEIRSRQGKLGEARVPEICKNFPRDLLFTRANRRHAAVAADNPLPMQGALAVWSAFNGALDEDDDEFRFAGEARTTNQLQGMAGRECGRALAIKNGGVSTIRNVSVRAFAPGTILTWCVPKSQGLPVDLTGNGRRLAELKEYRLSENVVGRTRLHALIKRSLSVAVNADALSNGENLELSHALFFGKGLRAIAVAAILSSGPATPAEAEKICQLFGLIDIPESSSTAAQDRKKAQDTFNNFLDVVFQASYDPKTQLSKTDPKRALFPDASMVVGRMRTAGNEQQKRANRSMLEGVQNITDSLAALIDSRKQRIFAISLSAANPGQDMDIIYTRK